LEIIAKSGQGMKFQDWVGREIEYRDALPLKESQKVFRGIILSINQFGYAQVKATHQTSFPVFSQKLNIRKGHYKEVFYRLNGVGKFPWQELKETTFHDGLFLSKSRWKYCRIIKQQDLRPKGSIWDRFKKIKQFFGF
jgi:hypothetical protein